MSRIDPPPGSLGELTELRTRRSKTFDLGPGVEPGTRRRSLKVLPRNSRPAHYTDEQGNLRTVRRTLDREPGLYVQRAHRYQLEIDDDQPSFRMILRSGLTMTARLARIDGSPVTGTFTSQRVAARSHVRYPDIVPGVDAIIVFLEGAIDISVFITDAAAPRGPFLFEATAPNLTPFKHQLNERYRDNIMGLVARPRRDRFRPVNVIAPPPVIERIGQQDRMRVRKTWTGEVAKRDPVTRIRTWSSDPADIAYPVRIGGL